MVNITSHIASRRTGILSQGINSAILSAKSIYLGLCLCISLGLIAKLGSAHSGLPVMMLAILMGLALNSVLSAKPLKAGIQWSSKSLLYIGVALLGLRMDLSILMGAGWIYPAFAFGLLTLTLGLGFIICRWLSGDKYFAILMCSAVAVCGVSAAAAVCCALPKCNKRDSHMAITVGGITVLSTVAMITYPVAASVFGFSETEAGIFMGGTIHNVSQAVGAGYMVSEPTGDIATLVKLLRVSALLPVIVIITFMFNPANTETTQKSTRSWTSYFPSFLIVFFGFALLKTASLMPETIGTAGGLIAEFCLIISMVAIGLKTDMKQVLIVGVKPLLAMTLTTLLMASLAIGGLSLVTI